jgi:hypothetical protein
MSLALIVTILTGIGGLIWWALATGDGWAIPTDPTGPNRDDELITRPLIQKPATVPADRAGLDDDAEVIGVSAGGRHRAYAVAALARVEYHVINDVVGGVPVTVTFCERLNCVRAFTVKGGTVPLDVRVGGWTPEHGGGMLLLIGKFRYRQDSGAAFRDAAAGIFPYDPAPYARTTWKAWRARHPDTDVFVGGRKQAGPAYRNI